MKLVLYGNEICPPVRAVLLTLRALELKYDFRKLDLLAGEHLQPDFVKKNPQHTLPTLEELDEGVCLWDSHAICAYLVRKYGQNDALYPKDPVKRAIVDQRLHFETGVLFYACLKPLHHLVFQEQATAIQLPKEKIAELHEAYALLESSLEHADSAFMAGNELTIADFSLASTLSTLHLSYAPIESTKYARLAAWLARMAELPYYEEANLSGARQLAELVRAKLPKQFDKLWQKAFEDIKSGRESKQ